jgi:amino acid adenylation domain-containing protein
MQENFVEGYRLSPPQRRLWHLQQKESFAPYRVQCAVLIEGPLRQELLRAAIDDIVEQYEILRTVFHLQPGISQPVQVIVDAQVAWGANEDLCGLSAVAQQARLADVFEEARRRRFDLAHGPLLHASLVKLANDRHNLFLTLPSLLIDRAGLEILVGKLSLRYAASLLGENVPEEPLQYADLAGWLNEVQEAEEALAGREFWRQQDFSALSLMALPFEKRPQRQEESVFHSVSLGLDGDLTLKLEAVAEKHAASLSVLLLCAWQVLLWRLLGQPDLIVGVANDGRSYEGLAEALGLFSKYLPLRAHFAADSHFSAVLPQVAEAAREVGEWQEYFAWEHLSGLSASGAQPHFFPFTFDFQESSARYAAAGVTFSIERCDACLERFKITANCRRRDDVVTTEFQYDARLFSVGEMQRLAGQFHKLLQSVVKNPATSINNLDILSEAERSWLLTEFSGASLEYPQDKCAHQLFEAQAAATPGNIAAVCGGQSLSYAQLNRRANQLAHHLRALGVQPGMLVGLCMERSLEMFIAVLGILKAGGAYVPLDPSYPNERLALMLRDAQVPWLLTQQTFLKELPEHGARVICQDVDQLLIAQQPEENPVNRTGVHNLAYVIYTSGTTGAPHGVMIGHDNLSHYLYAMRRAISITDKDRYLHTASIAFSSSVRQLFVPLVQGAAVVLATSEQRVDPLALFAAIKQQGVTIIDLVPAYWRSCLHALERLGAETKAALLDNQLRLILSASEPLTSEVPRDWTFGCKHGAQLINMFGQTETTGIVTVYPIPAENDEWVRVVPIGRPIANTQVYLLDQSAEPVPFGIIGELCLSGQGLGRGYFMQPALTAEKFTPHPFSAEPGARLYRTGDLARYLPDGNIEFVGRFDHQVKVRGYRIELGEIESVLSSHSAVRESAVIVRDDVAGERRLVAYVVAKYGQSPSVEGLQSFLQETLPEYMMPAAIVMLNELPLTPNGKLARWALPTPERARAGSDADFIAPRTPIEEALADIWIQILRLDKLGVHDNFFRLGGHSLLATVLMSRVRTTFQVELPVLSLFESPTVAGLAAVIEQHLIEQLQTDDRKEMLQSMDGLSAEEINDLLQYEGQSLM